MPKSSGSGAGNNLQNPRALWAEMENNIAALKEHSSDPRAVMELANKMEFDAEQLKSYVLATSSSLHGAFDTVTPGRSWFAKDANARDNDAATPFASIPQDPLSVLPEPSIVTPPVTIRATINPENANTPFVPMPNDQLAFMPISTQPQDDDTEAHELEELSSFFSLPSTHHSILRDHNRESSVSADARAYARKVSDESPIIDELSEIGSLNEDGLDLSSFLQDVDFGDKSIGINVKPRIISPESNVPVPGKDASVSMDISSGVFNKNKHDKRDTLTKKEAPGSAKRKKKQGKKTRETKYEKRHVGTTGKPFKEYIQQDTIDGDLLCLCGKGAHNTNHGGNRGFQDFAAPFLREYNALATSREKEHFARRVLRKYYDQDRRFLWVVGGTWVDMPEGEARKKIGQFFRDLNNPKKKKKKRAKF